MNISNADTQSRTSCNSQGPFPQALRRVKHYLQRQFAPGRFRLLYGSLGLSERTKLLDLGGTYQYWDLAQELGFPLPRVTLVNISPPDHAHRSRLGWVSADVRSVPFKDASFEAVMSNSVIEHLGDWESQQRFASEVRRLSTSYFVQTPNRAFPIEPHYVAPLIHWFPKDTQRLLARNFTLYGILSRPSRREIEQRLAELRLLTVSEMTRLFPDAEIVTEKALGLSKSIIACKGNVLGIHLAETLRRVDS